LISVFQFARARAKSPRNGGHRDYCRHTTIGSARAKGGSPPLDRFGRTRAPLRRGCALAVPASPHRVVLAKDAGDSVRKSSRSTHAGVPLLRVPNTFVERAPPALFPTPLHLRCAFEWRRLPSWRDTSAQTLNLRLVLVLSRSNGLWIGRLFGRCCMTR
jgi:hypothetical protein